MQRNPRTPYNGFGQFVGEILGTRMGMGKCGTTVPIYYKWQMRLHFPNHFLHLDLWGNAVFQHFPKTFLHLYLWGNALSKTSCNFLAHLNLWGNAFSVRHPRACQRLKMAAAWLVI